MRQPTFRSVNRPLDLRVQERANTRTVLLLLVLFLVGVAVGALWVYRSAQKRSDTKDEVGRTLADSTRAVLKDLNAAVEIRFYSLLGEDNPSGDLRDFAGRVQQLLIEFQRETAGSIKVTPYAAWSDASTKSAATDGIVPFNLDKGEPAYLGLAVVQDGRKETLSQLRPEWEPALEFDLARAISRVAHPPSPPPPPVSAADQALAENAAEEVQRAIPNLTSVSLEDAKRILREAALKDYKAAVAGMENEVKQAQQRLLQAERANSESDMQAAREQLRQVQTKYAEQLNQIAARSQAQIEALQRMKQE